MGRFWNSVPEAIAGGTACNFQLPPFPSFPLPGIPQLKLPKFPPKFPGIPLWCPFDEEAEEPLE